MLSQRAGFMAGDQRGSLLVFSYMVIVTLVATGAAGLRRSTLELNASSLYVNTQYAFHVAEAGLDRARVWLKGLPQPPTGTNSFDACADITSPTPALCQTCPCQFGKGTFTAIVTPAPDNPTSHLDLYTVTVTAQMAGLPVSRSLSQVYHTLSFARFAYFTNSELMPWGGRQVPVWFTDNDRLTGPIHTNGQLNISGDPIFDGEVSSGDPAINYYHGGPPDDNPQFNEGLALGASHINHPTSAWKLRQSASADGYWFEGNTTITLESTGMIRITNPASGMVDEAMSLPTNGAIFVNEGNATVSGTLDGQLSIGSSEDIVVAGSLCYLDHPNTDPAVLSQSLCYDSSGRSDSQSDDVLGLVAEKNVIIALDASDSAHNYDVEIQASIMALETSFTVERWWDRNYVNGNLIVYGGIIQDTRGPVGTFNSRTGQKRSGYSKEYAYDQRFADAAPPFFPTTGLYQELLWQEN